MSGHQPKQNQPAPPLDAADFEFLDYLIEKAIESCLRSSQPRTHPLAQSGVRIADVHDQRAP